MHAAIEYGEKGGRGRSREARFNLPNALTALRIFLVPLLVALLLTRARDRILAGAGVFALAVATDYLDGFLARRRNEVTRLGMLLDPIADKLLTAAAFLSLVEMGLAPAWMVTIILGRELAVTGLRNVWVMRGVVIGASILGKAKMVSQVVAILLLLLSRSLPVLEPVGRVALWGALVITLWSGLDYFWGVWRSLGKSEKGEGGATPIPEQTPPSS